VSTEIEIFCDGACSNNERGKGKGGWAAMIRRGSRELTVSGACPDTTNNRMELTAAISGIEMLVAGETATLYSDSQYVVNGITKWIRGWKKNNWVTSTNKRVLNQDLWERLDHLSTQHSIKFEWIRGHSTYEIDSVDAIAKQQTH
jgi:ribonuclease HI